MDTRISNPTTKIDYQKLIYAPAVNYQNLDNGQVMRIELDEQFTRIDFVYHAARKYVNGGWVNIHSTCFIRPAQLDLELKMIKAVNIPLAPKRHEFKSTKECLYYTLYFPALPPDTRYIDIIEKKSKDPSFFNFYGVSVEKVKKEIIIANN